MSSFIERNCLNCNDPFQARKTEVNRGNGKFCSRMCSTTHAQKLKHVEPEANTECSNCKRPFYIKLSQLRKELKTGNRFCSRTCMDSHQWRSSKQTSSHCENCGTKLKKHQTKYCSRKCSGEHKTKTWLREWLDEGLHRVATYEHVNDQIRNHLYKKYDSKCQKCGWNEIHPVTQRVPLTINHIDGNWRNNNPENVEIICPNCHSLTPNYGALNKGNGRPKRLAKINATQ